MGIIIKDIFLKMFKRLAVAALAMMSSTEAKDSLISDKLSNMFTVHVKRDDVEKVGEMGQEIERKMRHYMPEKDMVTKMQRHIVRFSKTDEVKKIMELAKSIDEMGYDHDGPRYFTTDEKKLMRLTEFQMRVMDMCMMGLEHGSEFNSNEEQTEADIEIPDDYWWYFNEQYAISKKLEKKIYKMEPVEDLREMAADAVETKEFKRILEDWKEQTQTEDHQEILHMLEATVEAALKVPQFSDPDLIMNAESV